LITTATVPTRKNATAYVAIRHASRLVGSSEVFVWGLSLLAFWLSTRFAWWIVPSCTLPHLGWPVFVLSHLLGIWAWIRMLALARGDLVLPTPKLMVPTLVIMVWFLHLCTTSFCECAHSNIHSVRVSLFRRYWLDSSPWASRSMGLRKQPFS
jgi:hypothetical protein